MEILSLRVVAEQLPAYPIPVRSPEFSSWRISGSRSSPSPAAMLPVSTCVRREGGRGRLHQGPTWRLWVPVHQALDGVDIRILVVCCFGDPAKDVTAHSLRRYIPGIEKSPPSDSNGPQNPPTAPT